MSSGRTPGSLSSRDRPPGHGETDRPTYVKVEAKRDSPQRAVMRLRSEVEDLQAECRRLQTALQSTDGVQHKVGRLSQAVEACTTRLDALTAQLETLSSGQVEMKAALARVEDEIPRVENEIRSSIYDMQDVLAARDLLPVKDVPYRQMVRSIRKTVRSALPRRATVIVVGRADKELMSFYGRETWPFPRAADGRYAGYYPACSTAAIAHLEALRHQGADYLLIPEPARWWLDHYVEFRRHLVRRYRLVIDQAGTCLIFALREPPVAGDVWRDVDEVVESFQRRYGRAPAVLDWHTGQALAARLPQEAVFSPPTGDPTLPYLDNSVDVVAVASPDAASAGEAKRVAGAAVITFTGSQADEAADLALAVGWKSGARERALPATSIVIPCFNGIAHTEACLAALWETLPSGFRGDVIVVDDGSDDETAARLQELAKADRRMKVIRSRKNAGFVKSCNRGAKVSRGDILVFLNNDTIPLPDWLLPLLRVFRDHPDAGVVGGKLIYPDGRLHDAGGIVFCDGSAANFGRGDYNPDAPLYSYLREVDYCSGALLATRRSLFEELGGFDPLYEPGYYEDADYCFKVRQKGCRVYFQSESAVVHFEGATAGTDLSVGMKRSQAVNQAKFFERWVHTLQSHPVRPDRLDFTALHALAGRNAIHRDDTQ